MARTMHVNLARIVALVLGLLGSLGVLYTAYIWAFALAILAIGEHNPNPEPVPQLFLITILVFFVLFIVGLSGAIASFFRSRIGGALMLGAGGVALTLDAILWSGTFTLALLFAAWYAIAYFVSILLLPIAGLLALINGRSKQQETTPRLTT